MEESEIRERLQACAADLSAWTSAEPDEVDDLLAEVARASALLEEAARALGPVEGATVMHYSVPGYARESAQTLDLEDARSRARGLAARTGTPAAILVHLARDGREVIDLAEVVRPGSEEPAS